MVFRLIQGVARAFSATCYLALVSEMIPKDKFSMGIGIFTIAQAIAQAVGPSLGLLLAGIVGYRGMFAVSAGLILLAMLLTGVIPSPPKNKTLFRISLNHIIAKEAFVPTLLLFLMMTAYCVVNSFLIIYAGEQGVESGIGLFFVVYAGAMLVSRPLIGKITDRLGTAAVYLPGMLLFAISFFLISGANRLPGFLVAAIIAAFGYGALTPALQALCMKSVPVERRGAASSTSYIGLDLGNLAGPIIAGMVAGKFGYMAMWRIMTIPIFTSVIVLIFSHKKIKKIESKFDKTNS